MDEFTCSVCPFVMSAVSVKFTFCASFRCQIKLARLTPYAVQFLRHLKDFTGVIFSFEEINPNDSVTDDVDEIDEENEPDDKIEKLPQMIVKCVGIGFRNIGKKTF